MVYKGLCGRCGPIKINLVDEWNIGLILSYEIYYQAKIDIGYGLVFHDFFLWSEIVSETSYLV
jgi:hypothetical protein